MTAPDLLPCPWCGSPAELERGSDHHGEWFNLGCSRHWGAVGPENACLGGRLFYTETEVAESVAAARWNTRASTAAIREALLSLPAVYAHQINTGVREVYDPLQRFYRMEDVLSALLTEKPHD